MSEISIAEVKTKDDLLRFVNFPMDLYKGNPYYVPSLIKDELNTWNTLENTALEFCEAKQFLAYKNCKVAGRIAVIFNQNENSAENLEKCIRFGWFDFIDDLEVSKKLIDTAIEFAKSKKIGVIEGPMGFTNLDKAGMLVEGYDRLATMIGLYNFPYYPAHLEKLGFQKEKEWIEFEIEFPKRLPEKIVNFNKLISEKYHLSVLRFDNKSEIEPLIEPMYDLLDETYKHLSTYIPLSEAQKKQYKEKYFKYINKDFVVCIVDQEKKLVAFAITMPSYSEALRKSRGKLFPFGWWYFWRAGIRNEMANFYLIGIHPDYQKRGVTSIIFKEIYELFKAKGVKYLETNPELAENKDIQLLWQDYHPTLHKRRRTYKLNF